MFRSLRMQLHKPNLESMELEKNIELIVTYFKRHVGR